VELAEVNQLFTRPLHPYTEALLAAMPRVDGHTQSLASIPGSVPAITAMPGGCAFAPRCRLKQARCEVQRPALQTVRPGHQVRCLVRAEEITA